MSRKLVMVDSKVSGRPRRVISAPNGLWLAQERREEKGTREKDNWVSLCGPQTFEDAISAATSNVGG